MSFAWPEVEIGSAAEPMERFEQPVPGVTYRQAGVRLWGGGAYEREPMDGGDTKYRVLNRTEHGDIIVNKIWARHGSVSVVLNGLADCYVSGEFPLFGPKPDRLDPRWFYWITRTRWFWNRCDEKSRGTSGKNRIRPEKFLEVKIPLPPLDEQRRLVAKIERLADKVGQAREMRIEACERVRVLLASVLSDAFPQPTNSTVATYAKVQSGYAFKSAWFTDDGIRLARNTNVSHGTLDWGDTARIPESMRGEYERFELSEGDILISLDRPLISTGLKVARVTQADLPCLLLQRVGRFQFHSDEVLPEYLFHWLHSLHFVHSIDPGRSNGVPHISQKDIERIPFAAPSIAEQRNTIAKLDAVYEQVRSVERLQHKTAAEIDALLPSILDKAFKGEL